MEIRSPFLNGISLGIPCTATSLTEIHVLKLYPCTFLKAGSTHTSYTKLLHTDLYPRSYTFLKLLSKLFKNGHRYISPFLNILSSLALFTIIPNYIPTFSRDRPPLETRMFRSTKILMLILVGSNDRVHTRSTKISEARTLVQSFGGQTRDRPYTLCYN